MTSALQTAIKLCERPPIAVAAWLCAPRATTHTHARRDQLIAIANRQLSDGAR